jgi:predicted DNA binding CopG/RHH family protein
MEGEMAVKRYPNLDERRQLMATYDAMSEDEILSEFFEALHRERLKPISLRLPESLIEQSKAVAKERGVPYQALIKALIETGLGALKRAS